MSLTYDTGETIEPGDRVDYLDEASVVELVVDEGKLQDETRWLGEQIGPGCILRNEAFGRVYVPLNAFDKVIFRRRSKG